MGAKNVNVFLTCTKLLKNGERGRKEPKESDNIIRKMKILFPEVPTEDLLCDCGTAYKVMLKKDQEDN